MGNISFGTEGWRAVMAEEFTTENVRIVIQAIADCLLEKEHSSSPRGEATGGSHPPLTIAVGYDTRFLSDRFARSVCEVLAGNGIKSILSKGTLPTCAVSRYVVREKLPGGIMVTASHNPAIYNGIKIKESFGGSATSETVSSVERALGRTPIRWVAFDEAIRTQEVILGDLLKPFLQGIRSFVDLPAIRRSRFHVVVDSMHGTGARIIEQLIKKGRCRVETLHAEVDPQFGGQSPEPIASHLIELSRIVKQRKASVGIANDGDADRIGVVAPDGRWINPGQVLCILLAHLVKERRAKGAVVKTVSNTMMINRMTEALGLRLIEVPVGFKHIAKLMMEDDILIGGEESGGIGISAYLPERDGILNGLLLLEALNARRQNLTDTLKDFERSYGRWTYGRQDLHLKSEQVERLFVRLKSEPPDHLGDVPVMRVDTLDGIKLIGRDERWLLFRRSGTEPIVRIYAESPKAKTLKDLLQLGVRLATQP